MAKEKTTIKKSKKTTKKKTTSPPKKEGDIDFSFLANWSTKLKIPVEELETKLEVIANGLREKHGERWTESKVYGTARNRLYSSLKADMRSSAIPWSVLILYSGSPNDYGARHYAKNLDAYAKNPKRAKDTGLVKVTRSAGGKSTAVPIEERQYQADGKTERKTYGKPIAEHAWIMNIGGIAIPASALKEEDWEKMLPFTMTVSQQYADPTSKVFLGKGFEYGSWYNIKATNRTPKDDEESYILNATSVTKWVPNTELELEDDQIKDILSDFYCDLTDLGEYHTGFMHLNDTGTKEQSFRLVVTEGEVVDIVPSPDDKQSHRLVLDDISVGFGDEDDEDIKPSTMCWIDPSREINFGKYSRIMVFGKTSAILAKDLATNETLDYFGPPSISVEGIKIIDLVEPDDLEDDTAGDAEEEYEPEGESGETEELDGLEDAEEEYEPEEESGETEELDGLEDAGEEGVDDEW